jgi:hypothetical protein
MQQIPATGNTAGPVIFETVRVNRDILEGQWLWLESGLDPFTILRMYFKLLSGAIECV